MTRKSRVRSNPRPLQRSQLLMLSFYQQSLLKLIQQLFLLKGIQQFFLNTKCLTLF